MEALDGNAIGGLLIEIFGTEMTTATGTCGSCGSVRQVAELVVYRPGLGTVVRCRTCGAVLMAHTGLPGRRSTSLTCDYGRRYVGRMPAEGACQHACL